MALNAISFLVIWLPAYSFRPPSARQQNAIQMAFRWRADDGPLLEVYWNGTYCFFNDFLASATLDWLYLAMYLCILG